MKHFCKIAGAALLLIVALAPNVVAQENGANIAVEPSKPDEVHGIVHAGTNASSPDCREATKVRSCCGAQAGSLNSTAASSDTISGAGARGLPEMDNAPKLTILRPREGESFKNEPIVVEVSVENFELTPPIPYFGSPNPKPVGHIHYFFDDYPEVATSSTQIMFGKKEGERYLRQGQHFLYAELVHDNHDNLAPRVWKRVDFNVSH